MELTPKWRHQHRRDGSADLEEWVTLLELDDAVGTKRVMATTSILGERFQHTQRWRPLGCYAPDRAAERLERPIILTMSEMTDIWGLANGFSHQIVQIYV